MRVLAATGWRCEEGRHESIAIFPKLFYLPGSDGDACELMCTHVDDLLYCYLPEGKEVIERFLNKFTIGSTEMSDFRYCGKQFSRSGDGDVSMRTPSTTQGRSDQFPLTQVVRVARRKISGDDIT